MIEQERSEAVESAEPPKEEKRSCIVARGMCAQEKTWIVVEHGLAEKTARNNAACIEEAWKETYGDRFAMKAVSQPASVRVRAYEQADGKLEAVEGYAARRLSFDEAVSACEEDASLRMEWSPWTLGKKIAVGACAAFVVAGVVAGVALGMTSQSAPEPQAQSASAPVSQTAHKAEEKKVQKSEVVLTLKAEGAESAVAKAKIAVKDSSGKVVVEGRECAANQSVSLGELEQGSYSLHVTSAPVNADGSTYKLPDAAQGFTVKDDGKPVVVECSLDKIAKEDMTKEQLEVAASVLEETGNPDAAQSVKAAAKEAPSVPGSAESVQRPVASSGGGSGNGGSGGSNGGSGSGSGGSNGSGGTPDAPSDSNAGKVWVDAVTREKPVYEQRWVDQWVEEDDPDNILEVITCTDCGVEITRDDMCPGGAHYPGDEPPFAHHFHIKEVYGKHTVNLGYYEDVLVGYETVVITPGYWK